MFSTSVVLVLIVSVLTRISSENVDSTLLRGVPATLISKYVSSKPFVCLDGSSTIPFEFVNDDYCDCRDGSDEPGTSACPNGRFFCENKGYVSTSISSHLVGDGICDCCDGSDEYETSVICNNTCFELAQKVKAQREATRALHAEGVVKKKEIIAKSVIIKSSLQTRLHELEENLQRTEAELKVKEELKQQAEILENEAKERHQKLWEEQHALREAIERDNQIREMFADLDTNNDSLVSIEELQKHTELDTDLENEFTVEEVRSILGANSVNLTEFNETVFEQISNSYKKLSSSTTTEIHEQLDVTTEANNLKNEEHEAAAMDGDDDEELYHHETSQSIATSLEHSKHIYDETVPEYDDDTKKLIELADHARHEYHEVERQIHDIKRQIEDLKRQSDTDLGVHGEYSPLVNQCYEYDEREYTYRICMFKDAKQISKGGGGEVTIGYWDSWFGPEDNKYLQMRYANGVTCWNGPARTLTVTFQCGIEFKIANVKEPIRCDYRMTFEAPSACNETIATAPLHNEHDEF